MNINYKEKRNSSVDHLNFKKKSGNLVKPSQRGRTDAMAIHEEHSEAVIGSESIKTNRVSSQNSIKQKLAHLPDSLRKFETKEQM